MKKAISIMLVCAALASSGAQAVFAEEPMVISAKNEAISILVDGKAFDLGDTAAYESGKCTMVPVRKIAEKLGYKVEWDSEHQGVKLDNGEVNTILYIGTDRYYMASSTADGMSAPTPLGAAPALVNGVTYVPTGIFEILGEKVSVKGEDNTQIPNPFTEHKDLESAKAAVNFEAKTPSKLPAGYKLTAVSTMGNDFLQVFYENGDNEINYRTAKGKDDISGDYNVYKNKKTVKIGDYSVTFRGNDGVSNAIWTDGETAYSVYANKAVTEKEMTEIIASVK